MTIGNFQNPTKQAPEPKEEAVKEQATPAKKLVDGIQANMENNVAMKEDSAKRSDDWRERLKAKDVSIDKARGIIDDMLTQGYYEETYPITKKVSVTFRSRTQGDYRRYVRALDVLNPRFNDEMQEVAMRYFITASIVRFGEKEFIHPPSDAAKREVDAAFEDRMDWIEKQADHVMMLLRAKLATFDAMLAEVFSQGVIENF